MKRYQCMLISLVVILFLGLSLTGCSRALWSIARPVLRIDRGPFVPFTPVDYEIPSIDDPVQSWTYHWPEDYERTLEAACSPMVDEEGNIYFIGKNGYLYSLDPAGEVRWKKKGFAKSMVLAKEGILLLTHAKTLIHFDFDGNILWSEPAMWWLGYDALKISPSGYLYYNDGEYIVCLDSQGKTVWAFHNIYGLAETMFFDEDSNAYMVGSRSFEKKNEQGIEEKLMETSLFSISSQGKLRWRQILCKNRNYNDRFTPKDGYIQDTILVALSTSTLNFESKNATWEEWYTDKRVQPKIIKAFNTDGEKLWERTEEKPGLFDIQYSVVPNGNIVYAFNVDSYYMNHDESIPESEYHVLSCVSNDGSDVWSHSFEHAIHTPVTFDSNGNLYVGTVSPEDKDSLCSLSSEGQIRWELKNIETAYRYAHNLVGSLNPKLYFTTENQSLLFCIGES